MIVALAGGVGGAKLAHGLYGVTPPDSLAVIVNTGDDFELFGLRISPDADTVMYTLAGIANPQTGWGIANDTRHTLDMLGRYGYELWFQLGDNDFATHIARTAQLRAGDTLTTVTARLASALGIRAALLPMSDEAVRTLVDTPAGRLEFQDYFVRRHHCDSVLGIVLDGIEAASITPAAEHAIQTAGTIVFCPSNPVVSIGPILAVRGYREALVASSAPRVAVSPIVGGKALRGPADQMLAGLGHAVSPVGVARLYCDIIDGLVIDHADAHHRQQIEALGLQVLMTDAVMRDEADRQRLATEVLAFAARLRQRPA